MTCPNSPRSSPSSMVDPSYGSAHARRRYIVNSRARGRDGTRASRRICSAPRRPGGRHARHRPQSACHRPHKPRGRHARMYSTHVARLAHALITRPDRPPCKACEQRDLASPPTASARMHGATVPGAALACSRAGLGALATDPAHPGGPASTRAPGVPAPMAARQRPQWRPHPRSRCA